MVNQIVFEKARVATLKNIALPVCGDDNALVKTIISGVSAGTELMWFNGSATALKTGRKTYPYFPGYELVGIVEEVGRDFKGGLSVGDRVFTMKPHASQVVLTQHDVWFKLDESVSNEDALNIALTGTAIHAIHQSDVKVGDKCAVVGLGVLGFNIMQVLSKGLCCDVVAATSSDFKINLSKENGASQVVGDLKDCQNSNALFNSCHVAFDCSGTNSGIAQALMMTAKQGNLVAAGFYTEDIQLNSELMFINEVRLSSVRATGSNSDATEYNRWTRHSTMNLAYRLIKNNIVTNKDLISHRFKVEDAEKMYELIDQKSEPYLQIIIEW